MPRSARIILPHTPHHIVQRGHNRQPVFFSEKDYEYYLENLLLFKKVFGCKVYAYCLMSNHVHLVIDPGKSPQSIALLMKRVAGRQTRFVNKFKKRTGSLWEGRYKSSIVSTKEYLPACCRYIELNPLRAGMVDDPALYPWSSYKAKVTGKKDPIIDYHPTYLAMGNKVADRRENYQDYVLGTVPDHEIKLIRNALQRGQLTGSRSFVEKIEKRLDIKLSNRGPGRPKKNEK